MRLLRGLGLVKRTNNGWWNRFFTTFDGATEHIDCGDSKQYDWNEPHSYMAIIKTNDLNLQAIVNKSQGSSTYKGFSLYMNAGNIIMREYEDGTSSGIKLESKESYNDDKRHIVIVTFDGSGIPDNAKMYIDGQEVSVTATGSGFSGTIKNSSKTIIGKLGYSSYNWFGELDEIIIFGKELTADDISYIYGNQTGEFDPRKMRKPKAIWNIGGWWRLGDKAIWDGSQWHFPDVSGNGYDGISQGMDETNMRRY